MCVRVCMHKYVRVYIHIHYMLNVHVYDCIYTTLT